MAGRDSTDAHQWRRPRNQDDAVLASKRALPPKIDPEAIRRRLDRVDVRVGVPDELDFSTAGELAAELATIEDNSHVSIDLSRLEFCDSRGLEVLFELSERISPVGGKITLLRPPDHFLRLLEISGWSDRFDIARPRDETAKRSRRART